MNQQTPQKPLVKSAIAIAVTVLGGLGIYAGTSIDEPTLVAANAGALSTEKNVSHGASAWGANPLMQAPAANVASFVSEKTDATLASDQHPGAASAPVSVTAEMMAQMELPANFVPNNAEGSTDNAPFSHIHLQAFSSGSKAIELLGNDLNAVAKWYGMSSDGFRQLLLTDSSVHLDRKGRMLHIDAGLDAGTAAGSTMQAAVTSTVSVTTVVSPFPLDQTFKLHTKPSSTRVLYLNFTGQGSNPAFDLDKLPATYSDAERLMIQKIWQRVIEDYAPFDVDITTEAPAVPLGKIGTTILITPQTSSAGGYAYLNSFRTFTAGIASAYCFPNNLASSEKPIAECISHELGHTLGLTHQGANPSTAYYAGQGSGETAWAPIMGVGYYKNLTQWSKGEYANANNKQDAYAIMLKQGLTPNADDHGNTIAFADVMLASSANGLNNLSGNGVIETPGDVDMFSFVAGAGSVTFKVNGSVLGGNLDVSLQLLDSTGKLLASANAADTLSTSISFSLPMQGTYFLSVTGAGKGDPLITGYSNYGSLGRYTISGTSALANSSVAVASIRTSSTGGKGPYSISFDASASALAGGKINAYQWNFGDGTALASTVVAQHTYMKAGVYDAVLKIIDSKGLTTLKGVKITIS